MNEIRCPKCGEVFTIDEAGYAAIVKQVRDDEFKKEIESRENMMRTDKETAIKIAESNKDKIITELNEKIKAFETEKTLAVKTALETKEMEINDLKNKNNKQRKNLFSESSFKHSFQLFRA